MIWFTHMKTTVEIADDLFARTREVAQREGTTLRALLEEGLRATLARREQKAASYQWPDLSVPGEGLDPEIEEGRWESLRDRIYAGRGA
jgi:predicted transcriptional regulator